MTDTLIDKKWRHDDDSVKKEFVSHENMSVIVLFCILVHIFEEKQNGGGQLRSDWERFRVRLGADPERFRSGSRAVP